MKICFCTSELTSSPLVCVVFPLSANPWNTIRSRKRRCIWERPHFGTHKEFAKWPEERSKRAPGAPSTIGCEHPQSPLIAHRERPSPVRVGCSGQPGRGGPATGHTATCGTESHWECLAVGSPGTRMALLVGRSGRWAVQAKEQQGHAEERPQSSSLQMARLPLRTSSKRR